MKIVNAPEIEYPIASTLLATGGSGRERNLIIDDKNGAKHANCMAHGKKTPINNKNIRTMTPTEWGKLQGFVNYAVINEDGSQKEKRKPVAAQSEIGNLVRLQLKLQFVSNRDNKFGIGRLSLGIADGIAEKSLQSVQVTSVPGCLGI